MTTIPDGQIHFLLTLGRDLLAIADLDTLLGNALERVMDFTAHDSGTVLIHDPASDSLSVRASGGADRIEPGTRVGSLHRSVAGHVLLSRRPLVLHGRAEELGTAWRDYTRPIPSSLCLPLMLGDAPPVGVLALKSMAAPRHLSEADIAILQLVAAQLAALIENARLRGAQANLAWGLPAGPQAPAAGASHSWMSLFAAEPPAGSHAHLAGRG